jgi:hypothetical protein
MWFHILNILLDLIAFCFKKLKVIQIMILEWVVITPPFIYWAFKYEYWLWLVLATSFLCTQLIRAKWIIAIRGQTRLK